VLQYVYPVVLLVEVERIKMNQEELKQQLIELLTETCDCGESEDFDCNKCKYSGSVNCLIEHSADNLIANGVTIRESGEWKDNIFCSRCGYAAEDDEGYILMSFDDFCPHCGADMRGATDTNVGDKPSWRCENECL
jgi:hypothetical protein